MVADGAPITTSQSTGTTPSSTIRTERISATGRRSGMLAVAATGSITRNIGAARPTRTGQPQISTAAAPVEIPWPTASRMRDRTKVRGMADSRAEPRIEEVVAVNSRVIEAARAVNSRAIEEARAVNSPARTIVAEEGRIALAIDKFRTPRVGRIRVRSVAPREGRAEARPAPAASAALPVWVAPEAAEGRAGAADGGGSGAMMKEKYMTSNQWKLIANWFFLSTLVIALCCALAGASHAQTQPKSEPSKSSQSAQKGFASPEQAADSLLEAAGQYDVPSLLQIFGSAGTDFVASADPVEDKKVALAFAAKGHEKKSVEIDPKNQNRAILIVGDEEWPFPIPIVKRSVEWYFDTKAGHQEILARRIGANELDAITICRGYAEAQLEYASQMHDNSVVFQYAQRVISTPGKHDGLAWQNSDGNWEGPVGEAVAKALADGYAEKKPFHGYYFKLLEGQGPAARLGTLNYFIEGVMIGGFAIVAWPAGYRVTGVKSFIVSYDGIVYQKDLGPTTSEAASAMNRYNPDKTWRSTSDDW